MKVTETYFKPRNKEFHNCYICRKPIDFTKLVQYKYSGDNPLVWAHVSFSDVDGKPAYLCAECRVLAYKRLGGNMSLAEYKILTVEAPTRKTRQKKFAL
jgi:hypothetical protein